MLGKRKKGQGLVEFALILPLLLLVILGIIEAGWLIWAYITVQNSAREAARYAVTGAPLDDQGNPWTLKPMRDPGDPPGTPNRSDAIKQVALENAGVLPIDVRAVQSQQQYLDEIDTPRAFGVSIRGQTVPDDLQGTPDNPGAKGLNILVRVYYNAPMLDPIYDVLMGGNFVRLRGEVSMQNEGINVALGGEPPIFAPPDYDNEIAGGDGGAGLDEYLEVRYEGTPATQVPAGSDVDIALERHDANQGYYVCFDNNAIPQSPVTTNGSGTALVSNYTISLLTTPGTHQFTSSLNADCSDPKASYSVTVVDATSPSIVISDSPHNKHGWPANSVVKVFISGHDPNTEYTVLFDGSPMLDPLTGGDCKITTSAGKSGLRDCAIPNTASVGTHQLSTSFTTDPYSFEVTSASLQVKGGNNWPDGVALSVLLRGHAPNHTYFVFMGQGTNYVATGSIKTNSQGDAETSLFVPLGYSGSYTILTQDLTSPFPPSASGPPIDRRIASTNVNITIPTTPQIVVQGGYEWPAGSRISVILRNHSPSTDYDVNLASGTVVNRMTTSVDGNSSFIGTDFDIPVTMSTGLYPMISYLAGSTTVYSATRDIQINAAPYIAIDGGNQHAPNQPITIRLKNHATDTAYDIYIDLDGVAGNGLNGSDAEYLIEAGIVTNASGEAAITYNIPGNISPTGINPADAHQIQSMHRNQPIADTDLFVVVSDLEVTSITYPSNPQPGVDLPVTIRVTNNEAITLTGVPFDNDLYVNPPPGVPTYTHQLPPGDRKIWINQIGPNQTLAITSTIKVYNEGTYALYGRTDTSNKVGEVDEANNIDSVSMPVQCTLTPFTDYFGNGTITPWTLSAFNASTSLGNGWQNVLAGMYVPNYNLAGLRQGAYTVEAAGLELTGGPELPVIRSQPPAVAVAPESSDLTPLLANIAPASFSTAAELVPAQQTLGTVKINFQRSNDTFPVPGFPDYLEDNGNAYGNRGGGRTYGWFDEGNNQPANNNTIRNRNNSISPDERYDTVIFMQTNGGNYYWQYALPNGQYNVFIAAGDPNTTNQNLQINVENVRAISENTSVTGNYFVTNQVTVNVTDGQLTISNASGSNNNRLLFVEITSYVPPAAPSGLSTTLVSQSIRLNWTDNSATPNEDYFIIQRAENTLPVDDSGWTQIGTTGAANITTYLDSTVVCGKTYYYRVLAYKDYGSGNVVTSAPSNASTIASYTCPVVSCSAATPFRENGTGQVVIEAEHRTSIEAGSGAGANNTWTEISETDASNGIAMQSTPNEGDNMGDTTNGPRMTYYVHFETPGNYYVYVRVKAPSNPSSGNNDSLHVGLDGAPATYGNTGLSDGFNATYRWGTWVSNSKPTTIVNVPSNRVNQVLPFYVWMREDGTVVDKIVLKQVTGAPSGTGPSESPCSSPTPPYPAPSNLQAVQGANATKVNLTWTDNNTNESRFIIERSTDGGATFSQLATVGANVTAYTDDVVCSQQYVYQVRSQRDSPAATSEPSNQAVIINPCPPPDPNFLPPTNVAGTVRTVTPGIYEIDVTWQNQTTDETEVRLERSDDGGATWTQVAILPGRTQTYTDSDVNCLSSYRYRAIVYRASPQAISNPSTPSTAIATGSCPVSSCTASGERDGILHLCSSGTGITAADDSTAGYAFLHQPVNSRTFDMIVRLEQVPNQTGNSLAGLEVRETMNSNAQKVSLVIRQSNLSQVGAYRRATAGGAVQQVGSWTNTTDTPPTWLRIVRANGQFFFYYNARVDDIPVVGAWNLLGSTADTMGAAVEVGMINATGNTGRSESLFSNFRIGCLSIATAAECGVVNETNGQAVTNGINYTDKFASKNSTAEYLRTQTTQGSYPAMSYSGNTFDEVSNYNFANYYDNAPKLEYSVNIRESGIYYLWILAYNPGNSGDSIHVGFDGVRDTYMEDQSSSSGLRWFNTQFNGTAYSKRLSQGIHQVNIWGRESGFQLVQVMLTTLPPDEYTPAGNAPLNQSICMEPVPAEFPPFLSQCTGNLFQQPGFETNGPWTFLPGSNALSQYRYSGSFGGMLAATTVNPYPVNEAPEMYQGFQMPDWINPTTKMLFSGKLAVLKHPNPNDVFTVNSSNDTLYLQLRDQNGVPVTNQIKLADGDDNPPGGSDNNITPPSSNPDDDFKSVSNKEVIQAEFTGTLQDLQDLAGQTIQAHFFAPNPAKLTPGLPANDPSRYSTVFWLDDVKLEVCTQEQEPAQDSTKGTVRGELVVVFGSTQVRVEGVTVWAYAIDPPGPVQTTYSVNTGFGQDNYSFYNLDPGEYLIYAEYEDVEGTHYGVLRNVAVVAGRTVNNFDLLLRVGQTQ